MEPTFISPETDKPKETLNERINKRAQKLNKKNK